MKIIHIQTQIQTILGELDAEGNVVRQIPVSVTLQKLNVHELTEACTRLLELKEKAAEGAITV